MFSENLEDSVVFELTWLGLVDEDSLVIEDISMIVSAIIPSYIDDRTAIDVHCRVTHNS